MSRIGNRFRPQGWRNGLLVILLGSSVAVSGCSRADTVRSDAGASVSWGATQTEYEEALKDMEPVVLQMQVAAASAESASAKPVIAFAERLEQYSGGKITVDVAYANGIVGVTEVDNALADGRLDVAEYTPIYEPSEYPANNVLVQSTFLRDTSIVTGAFQTYAALWETGWRTPEIVSEFEKHGTVPLNPIYAGGAVHLLCKKPIKSADDFEGLSIRVSGEAHAAEVTALKATPVSLTYPEVYEGLQRGIVDCAVATFETAQIGGWFEVAPHVVSPNTEAFPGTPGAYLAGTKYNDLPLAAQQLLFDSIAHLAADRVAYDLDVVHPTVLADIERYKGEFSVLDDVADERLTQANEALAKKWAGNEVVGGESFRDRAESLHEKWLPIVEGLGYGDGGTLDSYRQWHDAPTSTEAWLDAVHEDFLNEFRPS